VFFTI